MKKRLDVNKPQSTLAFKKSEKVTKLNNILGVVQALSLGLVIIILGAFTYPPDGDISKRSFMTIQVIQKSPFASLGVALILIVLFFIAFMLRRYLAKKHKHEMI